MLFKFLAVLVLECLSLGLNASAAPRSLNVYDLDAINSTTQLLNFTAITSGYCGTSGACSSFLKPPVTDCNMTTCACTDTVSSNLATCLQCGFYNIPGLTLQSAQAYLNNFTSGCAANGTSVQTRTLIANGATSVYRARNAGVWGALASLMWIAVV